MKQPIEKLLDDVPWHAVEPPATPGDLPYPTHRGVLKLGDHEIEVFQLSTGERVIAASGIEKLLGMQEE